MKAPLYLLTFALAGAVVLAVGIHMVLAPVLHSLNSALVQ